MKESIKVNWVFFFSAVNSLFNIQTAFCTLQLNSQLGIFNVPYVLWRHQISVKLGEKSNTRDTSNHNK